MEYKKRYAKYRKEVREHMENIIDNYEIEDGFILTLDLLAMNLELLYESKDSLKKDGLVSRDFKDRTHKNYAIQQFNSSQQTIIKLLSNFPSSTMMKERIKKLSALDDGGADMLENLLN